MELSTKDRTGKLSKSGLAIHILRVKDEHAIWKYESSIRRVCTFELGGNQAVAKSPADIREIWMRFS